MFNVQEGADVPEHTGSELGASVTDELTRQSVVPPHVVHEQLSCVPSSSFTGSRAQVAHLRQLIDKDTDGVKSTSCLW